MNTVQPVVLVTGAARGLGHALALAQAARGAHVLAMARTVGALEALDDAVKAAGGAATLIPLDVTDDAGLARRFMRAGAGSTDGCRDDLRADRPCFGACAATKTAARAWRRARRCAAGSRAAFRKLTPGVPAPGGAAHHA